MQPAVRHILLSVAAALVAAYVVTMWVVLPSLRKYPRCNEVRVTITDKKAHSFVTEEQLYTYLCAHAGTLINKGADSVSLMEVEQVMNNHPMVRESNAYFTPFGRLYVSVEQREPVLRVMTEGETYFVDADRSRMPVMSTTASYVPIITGRVSQRMACEELFDFVQWLVKDKFWSAQVEQIHVVSQNYIELVPRVGTGVIVLGDLHHVESKLSKLRTLYEYGLSSLNATAYREIDLRFKGQVVCRK